MAGHAELTSAMSESVRLQAIIGARSRASLTQVHKQIMPASFPICPTDRKANREPSLDA